MSIVATVVTTRPDAAKFWLFVHILGGMATVGALTLCLVSLVGAWRTGSQALTRLGFRALLWGAVPAFIVMRVAAQIVLNKEGLDSDQVDLTWINIGFTVTDVGVLLLIISTILGWLAVRRANRGGTGPSVSARVTTGLVSVLLVAYLVAVWAMTTKPT
jgi:hypothetical protein